MLEKFFSIFNVDYGRALENYIVSRKPETMADVERFEKDFEHFYFRNCNFHINQSSKGD